MGNVIFIGQLILIVVQIVIIGIMFYKDANYDLTDKEKKDYEIANWACCGGVWLLFFIKLILF